MSLLSLFPLPAISAISSRDTHIAICTRGSAGAWFPWQAWRAGDAADEARSSFQPGVPQLPKHTVAQTDHPHQCPHLQLCECTESIIQPPTWPTGICGDSTTAVHLYVCLRRSHPYPVLTPWIVGFCGRRQNKCSYCTFLFFLQHSQMWGQTVSVPRFIQLWSEREIWNKAHIDSRPSVLSCQKHSQVLT